MQNILRFIIKYNYYFLFIILEIISFSLIVRFNKHQQKVFLSTAGGISGGLNQIFSSIDEYFNLKQENEKLTKQNAFLLSKKSGSFISNKRVINYTYDSLYSQQYQYINAKIIANTIWKKHNYLTLDKGKRNGVVTESAVISPQGVVGITKDVGNNFCNVISILNTELKISGKIKKNNYFGSISWDGKDYQFVKFNEIPFHVNLSKGDTVVTSGYSLIFPEGIIIGTISEYSKIKGGDFYNITIKLSVDLKNINNIFIIKNLKKEELQKLSQQQEND